MGKSDDDGHAISAVEREIDELRRRTAELVAELERRVDGTLARARRGVRRLRSVSSASRLLGLLFAGVLVVAGAASLVARLRPRRRRWLALGPRSS
jgi:hypothetical protein